MENDFYSPSYIEILVDEYKNLALFPLIPNPNYSEEIACSMPMGVYDEPSVFPAKKPIELSFPYTAVELADAIERGFMSWNQYEPFTSKRQSSAEYYYGIKGFKKATFGKKYISVFRMPEVSAMGNRVSISLPAKAGKYYLGITHISLAEDADWLDFARAVIELVEIDITQDSAYKVFKRKLNV